MKELPVEDAEAFLGALVEIEPRLRRALVAAYGQERGRDAAAEALAWAFEHQDRLAGVDNLVAYLFRVGQSRSRTRKRRVLYARPFVSDPLVEPGLPAALNLLSEYQRVVVVLVHAFDWSLTETAELLGVAVSTAKTHLDRGLEKLKTQLGVGDDGED